MHSAKQNEIREQYYAVEAKKGELQRIIDDEGEKITYVFKIFLRSNGAMQVHNFVVILFQPRRT